MPEIAVQRLIQVGLADLRSKPDVFNEVFAYYNSEELVDDFGPVYIDKIRKWFFETKIPVLMAWGFTAQRLPAYSVNLASESEDESKAAMSDFVGMGANADVKGSPFTVQIDIGIHADKNSDYVLWMYYAISYILLKNKLLAEKMGLRLHTWSASDYNRDAPHTPENCWSRWIRFKCTVQNEWNDDDYSTPLELELGLEFESINE